MKTTHESLHPTSKIVPCKRCHLSSIYWERFPDCDYAEPAPASIDWVFVFDVALTIGCVIVFFIGMHACSMRHP